MYFCGDLQPEPQQASPHQEPISCSPSQMSEAREVKKAYLVSGNPGNTVLNLAEPQTELPLC